MKIIQAHNLGNDHQFVKLHGPDWLERLRIAGNCLSGIMKTLVGMVNDRCPIAMSEIDSFVKSEILKKDCTPTFKSYRGFPASICISVNNVLVHGIPTDYKLQDGDLVSFDFGVTYKGAIADSATTCIFGTPKSNDHVLMVDTAKNCLSEAINKISVGKRLGIIGDTIYKTARDSGFRVIENYGGHGITENTPHAEPFVSNRDVPSNGIRIQPGMTIAIEPLLVPNSCSVNTKVAEDGWSVITNDISCHQEHTIYVHDDNVEIITAIN